MNNRTDDNDFVLIGELKLPLENAGLTLQSKTIYHLLKGYGCKCLGEGIRYQDDDIHATKIHKEDVQKLIDRIIEYYK